jgi:hypothetical protein
MEWVYGAAGAVTLDEAQSDQHPDIAATAAVVDSGTAGITNVRFPKCLRAWVHALSFEPATADLGDPTDYRALFPVALLPLAGTLNIYLQQIEAVMALADPETGARVRLTLKLEF